MKHLTILIILAIVFCLGCSGGTTSSSNPIPLTAPVITGIGVSYPNIFGQFQTLNWTLSGGAPTSITIPVDDYSTGTRTTYIISPDPTSRSCQIFPPCPGEAAIYVTNSIGTSYKVAAWTFWEDCSTRTSTTMTWMNGQPIATGTPVTLTASVSPTPIGGEITFTESATGSVIGKSQLINGMATIIITITKPTTILSIYEGNSPYFPSISAPSTITP